MFIDLFVRKESLHVNQQYFSHVGTFLSLWLVLRVVFMRGSRKFCQGGPTLIKRLNYFFK